MARFCLFVCVILAFLALPDYVTADEKFVEVFQPNSEDSKSLDEALNEDFKSLDEALNEDSKSLDEALNEDSKSLDEALSENQQESRGLDINNLKTEINQLKACVHVTYLHDYKYDVEVTSNDEVSISNKTVDIEDSPSLCYKVPNKRDNIRACVEFNDVTEKHACVELSGSISHEDYHSSVYVHVACFTIQETRTSSDRSLENSSETEE